MKTEKEIIAELKKYDVLDNPKEIKRRGLYGDLRPISEWLQHQDIGFRKALKWVLEIYD